MCFYLVGKVFAVYGVWVPIGRNINWHLWFQPHNFVFFDSYGRCLSELWFRETPNHGTMLVAMKKGLSLQGRAEDNVPSTKLQ